MLLSKHRVFLYRICGFSRSLYRAKHQGVLKESYLQGLSESPLLGKTIGVALQEAVERTPDRLAAVFCRHNIRYTFQQLLQSVDEAAAGLLALGVQRGDRVGVWGPNVPQWLLLQLATARIGAVMVNINPSYRPTELEFALNKTGCGTLLLSEPVGHQDFYGILAQLVPEIQSCKSPTPAAPGEPPRFRRLPHLRSLIKLGGNPRPGVFGYKEFTDLATSKLISQVQDLQKKLQFDEPINIQFTSGTTGTPKGATLTHHNILNNAFFLGERIGYNKARTIICSPVPFYHCFGMVMGNMQMLTHNVTMVIPSTTFSGDATFHALQRERCTTLYGTPTMFIDVVAARDRAVRAGEKVDLSSMRDGITAGAPMPPEVMSRLIKDFHMTSASDCYGSTEISPVCTMSLASDTFEERVNTVGYPMAHVELRIVDPEKLVTMPIGQSGEVWTRGYSTMLGYWDEEKKTREVITPTNWYRTGDLGRMRATGHVEIVGRIKDMIIRGGENVYPAEIEAFFHKHPNVEDIQVIGVPDRRLGEQVCAYVRLKDKTKGTTAQELRDFCKDKIAYFKVPHYIVFTESFPLTISGKVQKFKLRERALKDLNLQTHK